MHRITLNAQGADALHITAGVYLVDDSNTGEFMINKWLTDSHSVPPAEGNPDTAADLLLIRAGGIGDLLQLTTVLADLHHQQPDRRLGVSCIPRFSGVLENLPFPVEIVAYPLPLEELARWEAHISLEDVVEANQHKHSTEALAAACGVDALTRPHPYFRPTLDELGAMQERFPRKDTEKRLGIQLEASAKCRTWSAKSTIELARRAIDKGWNVMAFGSPGTLPIDPKIEGFTNLTLADPPLTFREAATLATSCDVLVVPDSAFCHVAGACGIPAVALFAAFHWKFRTLYYDTVRAIQGKGRCAPCFHQVHAGREWPVDGPCNETGKCMPMFSIEPRRVMQQVEAMHAKFQHTPWSYDRTIIPSP